MKYNKFLILAVLPCFLGSCSNTDDYSEFYDGVISVSNPGFKTLQSYNVGLENTESFFIQRGGFTSPATKVDVIVDETMIDSINKAQGKNYKILPKDCYEIITPTLQIEGENRLFEGKIKYDPAKIYAINGNVYDKNDFILPIRFKSEGMQFVPGRSELIYDFKVSEAITTIFNTGITELSSNIAEVNIGVPFVNQWNINITTKVDEKYVESYNKSNGTYFQLLPAAFYTSTNNVTLSPELSDAIIEYKIDDSKVKSGCYLLPIKLDKVEAEVEIKKDEEATAVFKIQKLGERIAKTDWKIVSFTTEEPTGENNGNNGRAIHLIDGKSETFWHSKWKGGSDPLPYEIVVDLNKRIDISQVEVLPRGQNSNNPIKLLEFYVSDNNQDWNFIGKFSFTNIDDYLIYNVKKTAGRYLKMVLPDDGGNGTVAAIRELEVRGEVLN